MARIPLDTLEAKIATDLPDNINGLITPAKVRGLMIDIVQSLQTSWALMWGEHSSAPIVRTVQSASWTILAGVDLYTNTGVSDPAELNAVPASGSMPVQFADYVHSLEGQISVSGPINRELSFAVGYNGIPLDGSGTTTLGGASNYHGLYNALTFVGRAGWNLQLMARFTDGAGPANINIAHINMTGALEPTHTAN